MPSSTSCAGGVPGACSRMTCLQQENRLPLFPPLAHRWYLGAAARGPTQEEGAGTPRQRPAAYGRHRRQPEREDHRHRWGRARLRPGQESEGKTKRHLLVDTQGLVLKAKVHAASVFDRDGIKPLMEFVGERFPRLSHLCGSMPATTR
jgi:hypothetical protein